MKLTKFMAGLEILKPYYNDNAYALGAEHDQIYLYATDRPLTPEDAAHMKELGWFQDEVPEDAPYDPEQSWSAFV